MSSQMLFYVWENKRWTSQKSSSPEDGMIISSNTENLLGWLMEKRLEVKRDFCKTREVRAWIRHVHWCKDRKRLATLKSIQMTQKENCMNWQSMLRNCISYRSIHSWRGCIDFQKGEMKKGGANMHFNADDSSVTMVMDLISSANDICIAFGICDYLGKFSEIDVESRRNSASVVLTPSLGERHSASTSAFCSWECLKLCSDSGGKPPATTESTNKNVNCRKSERKDRRRTLSTLSNCRLRRNLQHRGAPSNEACTKQRWIAQHTLCRSWQTNQCWRWPITS